MTESKLHDHWNDPSVAPPPTQVETPPVQVTYAIVDGLGRPTAAAAILFSPFIKLTASEGELMNVTLYSSIETAEKMLASAKSRGEYHIVPYGEVVHI